MLEGRGLRYVAALAGGVAQWLSLGFSTTRDPAILDRCDVLRPIAPLRARRATRKTLRIEQVEEHLGDPLSVRWIKIAALVLHAHLSCIDGRDDRGIVGTPGGDSGQFLLALAAIESTLQRSLDTAVITGLPRTADRRAGRLLHAHRPSRHAGGGRGDAGRPAARGGRWPITATRASFAISFAGRRSCSARPCSSTSARPRPSAADTSG